MDIKDIKAEMNRYIDDGEIVYGVDIHAVGFELRIKSIRLEDIMGSTFMLNGNKITKEEFKEIEAILEPVWKRQGEQMKNRGLY